MNIKKLIEVALPLEKINAESAREKCIRFGHPATLHLWWARRPLAAARAVIWASLVDDPSSHPEKFPTQEAQNKERQRLFKILEDLVVWENSKKEDILNSAKAELMKSVDKLPVLLDPFAGGGAIPLEALRLGLEAHAHDLNPVAVTINKAMIEIPSRFAGQFPVNPESRRIENDDWKGICGLAEDVRYYGEWMKQEAYRRIGHLYPNISIPPSQGGGVGTVIAWIWTRTVKCPNPACGCEMPLARDLYLSKKKGDVVWMEPRFEGGKPSFIIQHNGKPTLESTVGRQGAICACCGASVPLSYIREQGKSGNIGSILSAIVTEKNGKRIYVAPDDSHKIAAQVAKPEDYPDAELPHNPRDFKTPNYGLDTFAKLYTNRQLVAMTTFSALIEEVRKKVETDAAAAGLDASPIALADGGKGAFAYGEAIGVYLSFVIDKMTDYHSSICSWNSSKELMRNTFGRQAIPMTWNYAEANPFSNSTGCFSNMLDWVVRCIVLLPVTNTGVALQCDAQSDCGLRGVMISTDPPYYDNIGYADLSDFFYIWLRKNLKNVFPKLFNTVLVPKLEELVATSYRHERSAEKAKRFFEDGMLCACKRLYECSRDDIPVTIYYAYKQNDTDDSSEGTVSSGWETMLSAIIKAGFAITGTWPMRTEMENRQIASGTNALASSIVLVCRKRSQDAPVCQRRNFINELKREIRPALQKLQSSNIAPVDLAQSAIGPGMGVYSKYSQVLDADGTPMSVRSALKIINQELDVYLNEQDSTMDSESRFCVALYSQIAFNDIRFGDANTLATAKNTSVARMVSNGTLYAQKGVVHLIDRPDLPQDVDKHERCLWLLCQQLTYKMEKEGIEGCAHVIANMFGSNAENAKDLAYRLYTIAEQKKWAQEAYAYNALVVAWPRIQSRAAELKAIKPKQGTLFDNL